MIEQTKVNYLRPIWVLMLFFTMNVSANDAIWAKLAEGGKVIVIRHAQTKAGTGSNSPLVRDASCKKERMLSAKGRVNAKFLGHYILMKKIPVTKVLHSPFCRTTDTASIAFQNVRAVQYLSLLEILNPKDSAKQTEHLNKIIGSFTGKGNLILVTHRPNISAIAFEKPGFLDILVLQPRGGNKYEEIGIIKFSTLKAKKLK